MGVYICRSLQFSTCIVKNFKLTNGFRSYLVQQIKQMDLTAPKRVNIEDWKGKRGLSANALSHVWYGQIAEFISNDAITVKAECKIDHGLPIALNNEDSFPALAYILDKTNFWNMTREQQVILINGINITSKFNTKEMSDYMNSLQVFWGGAGLNLESE